MSGIPKSKRTIPYSEFYDKVIKVHKSSKSHGKTMYANHKSIRSLDKYFKQLFWKELKENNIKLDF